MPIFNGSGTTKYHKTNNWRGTTELKTVSLWRGGGGGGGGGGTCLTISSRRECRDVCLCREDMVERRSGVWPDRRLISSSSLVISYSRIFSLRETRGCVRWGVAYTTLYRWSHTHALEDYVHSGWALSNHICMKRVVLMWAFSMVLLSFVMSTKIVVTQSHNSIFNPWHACAARVTVLGLSVRLLPSFLPPRATNR